jgi:hypothetical protein
VLLIKPNVANILIYSIMFLQYILIFWILPILFNEKDKTKDIIIDSLKLHLYIGIISIIGFTLYYGIRFYFYN